MTEVSVIIPTYCGASRIGKALESVRIQDADVEVVCVVNGPDDGTHDLLLEYQRRFQNFNLKVVRFHGKGAGAARNLGLNAATGERITFLDDDDTLAPGFLGTALEYPNDAIVCMPIWDVPDTGRTPIETSLSARLRALGGKRLYAREAPWLLSFNAAKLIPARLLSRTRYRSDLRSGEDVVFYAELALVAHPEVQFQVVDEVKNGGSVAYLRSVRPGSRSRQSGEFGFDVTERFEVIKALSLLKASEVNQPALVSLQRAQLNFVSRYLEAHPDSRSAALLTGTRLRIPSEIWKELNASAVVETLVISYCFPPFNDPSGTVAAKRVIVNGETVDCISADMSTVRSRDESLQLSVAPYLRKHQILEGPPSFSDWAVISDFGRRTLRLTRSGKEYSRVYTRAMWSASHVAGALIKLSNPSVKWTAEFSDPMRTDATGGSRPGPLVRNRTTRQLTKAVEGSGLTRIPIETHFELVEAATCVLASELLFTNANQLETVTSAYPPDWQRLIRGKSVISPQPTLPRGYYEIGSVPELSNGLVKIGYFGSFYANRGLESILIEAEKLPEPLREKIEFVIFTRTPTEVELEVQTIAPNVRVTCREYLEFLDFLAALDELEVLLVVDANTGSSGINPFLPSKFADYDGAKSAIWAVEVEGSPISKLAVEFRSNLNQPESISRTLVQISSKDWSARD